MAEAKRNHNKPHSSEIGFTLIEIMIAIFLLASSLTILLGLQSAVVSRAINDQSRAQAMLVARRILAGIETGEIETPEGESSKSAREQLGALVRPEDSTLLDDITINMLSEPWEVPNFEKFKIRKITLNLVWGPSQEQQTGLYYFIPEDEGQEENLDDEE